MTDLTVGFIGLGTMGGPMALNIRRHGYPLVGYDIRAEAMEPLVAAGARAAGDVAEVAATCDVVITMLPDVPDVEKVALGASGIVESIRPGGVHIEMSTIDPGTSRRIGAALAERGAAIVDCPVGRTEEHAIAGTLALMAGGEPEVVERVRPVLLCMGDTLFYCGPVGNGHAMKLVNNMLAQCVLAATSEALVVGRKTGLTLDVMLKVLGATLAGNQQLAVALPKKAFADDFTPGFQVRLGHKDMRLAVGLAETLGIRTPVGDGAMANLDEALGLGFDRDDITSLLRVREADAGLVVRWSAGGGDR